MSLEFMPIRMDMARVYFLIWDDAGYTARAFCVQHCAGAAAPQAMATARGEAAKAKCRCFDGGMEMVPPNSSEYDGAAQSQEAQGAIWLWVPDEAKAWGAKWDRQAHAWYVPAGIDAAPFAQWTQRHNDDGAPERRRLPEREYLDVPYGERKAAKAAGAAWDPMARCTQARTATGKSSRAGSRERPMRRPRAKPSPRRCVKWAAWSAASTR